ncbi:MAG: O-antigen ligase family protein [Sarcina sp.]
MKITNEFVGINKSIEKILIYLFIAAIILIPFDNLPYLKSLLGELSFKASVYPFIAIIIIIAINTIVKKELYVSKKKEYYLLYCFIGWIVISNIVNGSNIINNVLKGRTGVEKLILQFMVISFMFLVLYSTELIISLKKISLVELRKYIFYSAIPVVIYGVIELLTLSRIIDFSRLIESISYHIQTYYRGEVYTKGIRSVTGEVSYFAMYLAFALPWISSFIFTEKKKIKQAGYILLTLILLVLMVFSKSRTAYAIIFVQMFLFITFILLFKIEKSKKILLVKSIVGIVGIFIIFNFTFLNNIGGDINSVSKISVKSLIESLTDPNNMSNVARGGMQKAAFDMGKDSPIFGVGLGQYGFNTPTYISDNAMRSDEVKVWISNSLSTKGSWPPVFAIYPRIFAEQGIIGAFLWIAFISLLLIKFIKRLWKKEDDILSIALIVSYLCILISWWNFDTFASFSFWILTPFLVLGCNE